MKSWWQRKRPKSLAEKCEQALRAEVSAESLLTLECEKTKGAVTVAKFRLDSWKSKHTAMIDGRLHYVSETNTSSESLRRKHRELERAVESAAQQVLLATQALARAKRAQANRLQPAPGGQRWTHGNNR